MIWCRPRQGSQVVKKFTERFSIKKKNKTKQTRKEKKNEVWSDLQAQDLYCYFFHLPFGGNLQHPVTDALDPVGQRIPRFPWRILETLPLVLELLVVIGQTFLCDLQIINSSAPPLSLKLLTGQPPCKSWEHHRGFCQPLPMQHGETVAQNARLSYADDPEDPCLILQLVMV